MFKKIIKIVLIVVVIVGIYGLFKPIPAGVDVASEIYNVPSSSVQFLGDMTYTDSDGIRHSDQQIFDEVFEMIDDARHYILIDMFLFNDFLGSETESYRELSSELIDALIDKKEQYPDIDIQVITDPINTIYGGYDSEQLGSLRENNISVAITDLSTLRDSNPAYSAFWRTFFQWLPDSTREILPNLFDDRKQKVSINSYLNLLNFKANHRKVILTDYEESGEIGFSVLITSANPHDGSSAHSNTAIRVDDALWRDVLGSEKSVVNFSGQSFVLPSEELINSIEDGVGDMEVQLLTERAIKEKILEIISNLDEGDELDMVMFYISDRDIVKALKRADGRGVSIRILLDPNKDAFGREKNGVPNRQVANELISGTDGNTEIRWCDTNGEQCHGKMLIFKQSDKYSIIQGSANLTRRNLDNFNLETNVYISGDNSMGAIAEVLRYFEAVWSNQGGRNFSTEYEVYADESMFRKMWYRFSEFTGMSSY